MSHWIPVSQPYFDSRESDYVKNAIDSRAISGNYGEYIPQFEESFAKYCGTRYGVSVTNGTTALHIALAALDIGEGDEVLVSTLTNMATFFAVLYQGATPVPVDIEADTLNMDPALLESKITPRTRAILPVHLFGHPVDMDPVMDLAKKHGLHVVEDCAEAHGASYKGRVTGSMGDAGCFSFFANKIITTGEGGMITTSDKALDERVRSLKSLAFGDQYKFMHKEVGFSYRMTNLQAAVGCAQIEKIDDIVSRKRRIAHWYAEELGDVSEVQLPVEMGYAHNVYWMYHIVLKGMSADGRQSVMKSLLDRGIESREGFIPYNLQEIFIERGLTDPDECPVANTVAYCSMYLPSGPDLSKAEVRFVCDTLKDILTRGA